MTSQQLDLFPNEESSPQAGLVRISPWRAVVKAWLAHVQGCGGKSCDSLMRHTPVGSSERTSLACCQATADRIWVPLSGRWETSGMGSPTEFWTLSSSEFPSAAVVCSLSDILESPGPHLRKYFLSAKAASGILRRAAKRGRALPLALHAALETLSQSAPPDTHTHTLTASAAKLASEDGTGRGVPIVTDTHTHTRFRRCRAAGNAATGSTPNQQPGDTSSWAVAALTAKQGGPDDNSAQAGHIVVQQISSDRFWSKVEKTETCWLWKAGKDGNGYGVAVLGSRSDGTYQLVKAHRHSYESLVGPIPDGLHLDHLCRVRHCVNPEHLEPVTQRENILRGEGASAQAARQTHCKNGHELVPENLVKRANPNARECKVCHRDRERNRKQQPTTVLGGGRDSFIDWRRP